MLLEDEINPMSDEPKTRDEKIAKIRELIRDIDLCMLTTMEEDGSLHSRPMSVNEEVEFDGDLWFFTYGSSHKVFEIEKDHRVNVSFADPKNQRYVSISGLATISRDRAKIEELWHPVLKAWFPDGPDTPDIALIKVESEAAEYWDSPGSAISHAIGLVKSLVTHETVQIGENHKVDL
jgi:general stress protein 26